MFIEEECRLFGLHFEPMCHETHTVGIQVSKEQVPNMHAHKSRHTHASHVHTHNTLYAHVYTCTHCGRKGHLAKFYFDKIHDVNLANKFVWVRKGANSHESKRVWVPKTTPILFDVGVGSHMT